MAKNKAAQELGRRGAKALLKKYGKEYYSRIRRGEKPSGDGKEQP
jgi:hypothetical protein